jgi:hypothetical protein
VQRSEADRDFAGNATTGQARPLIVQLAVPPLATVWEGGVTDRTSELEPPPPPPPPPLLDGGVGGRGANRGGGTGIGAIGVGG